MIIELKHLVLLALLFCIAGTVLHWAKMRMGFFTDKRPRERCIEIAKKKKYFEYYIFLFISKFFIPGFIAVFACSVFAYARLHPKVDNYTYLKNDLAVQRDTADLFREDVVDTTKQEEREDHTNKLHIPERFIGRNIDAEMYNYFYAELSQVYVNGTKIGYDPAPEIASDGAPYDVFNNASIQEAEQYRADYNNNPNQASLYQYGRALSEFEAKGSSSSFEVTFFVMSESLWSLESFLQYADRDVGDKNSSVVIDAHQVAFLEGKMFLRNTWLAAKSEEGAYYSNCFLVESLVSFEIGLSQIDPSNKYYALLAYYVGNSGQNALCIIDKGSDPELYSSIGNKAMRGYQNAKKYCEANPGFYLIEPNMLDNIDAGIRTLTTLGISAE